MPRWATRKTGDWTVALWVKSPLAPAAGPANGPVHRDRNFVIGWNHGSIDFRGAAALSVAGNWTRRVSAACRGTPGTTWPRRTTERTSGVQGRGPRDGQLAASGVPDFETNSLKLGRHATEPQFFTGLVDEIRIYDRALSAAEIQAVFEGEVDPCADGAGCDDGNACTTGDTCAGGVCQGGPALACGDGNACTTIHATPRRVAFIRRWLQRRQRLHERSCNPRRAAFTLRTRLVQRRQRLHDRDTCGGGAATPVRPSLQRRQPEHERHVVPETVCVSRPWRHRPRRPLAV